MTRRAWPLLVALLPLGCLEKPKPTPLARKPSLYTRLGGQAVLAKAIDGYLDRLEVRGLFVSGRDRAARKQRMLEELTAATGGPRRPRGKGLKELFSGVELRSHADFDSALLALEQALEDALKGTNLGERTRREVIALVAPLRGAVVGQAE